MKGLQGMMHKVSKEFRRAYKLLTLLSQIPN